MRLLDLDLGLSIEKIRKLSDLSGVPFEDLYDASFLSHEHFYWLFHYWQRRIWLHRPISSSNKKRGIAICPQCLAGSETPYFRKQWRLSYTTVCKTHKQQLVDSCPRCSNRFYDSSISLFAPDALYCDNCQLPISTIDTPCSDDLFFFNKFYSDTDIFNPNPGVHFRQLQFIIEALLSLNGNDEKYIPLDLVTGDDSEGLGKEHHFIPASSKFENSWKFGNMPVSYRHAVLKDAFFLYERGEYNITRGKKCGIIIKN